MSELGASHLCWLISDSLSIMEHLVYLFGWDVVERERGGVEREKLFWFCVYFSFWNVNCLM